MKLAFLGAVGGLLLVFAMFCVAGYVFGWAIFSPEDWLRLVIDGAFGVAAAVVVAYRMKG